MRYFIERLFKMWGVSLIYESKYGLKALNKPINSSYFDVMVYKILDTFDIAEIVFPIDYLKNQHTLLGINVKDSPHYRFIEAIDKDIDLTKTDYYLREINGTLDFRSSSKPNIKHYTQKYSERLNEINNGVMWHIYCYYINDHKLMIADGKHKLAMATYFGYDNIKIKLIPCLLFDTFFMNLMSKVKSKSEYSLHKEMYERVINDRKRQIN